MGGRKIRLLFHILKKYANNNAFDYSQYYELFSIKGKRISIYHRLILKLYIQLYYNKCINKYVDYLYNSKVVKNIIKDSIELHRLNNDELDKLLDDCKIMLSHKFFGGNMPIGKLYITGDNDYPLYFNKEHCDKLIHKMYELIKSDIYNKLELSGYNTLNNTLTDKQLLNRIERLDAIKEFSYRVLNISSYKLCDLIVEDSSIKNILNLYSLSFEELHEMLFPDNKTLEEIFTTNDLSYEDFEKQHDIRFETDWDKYKLLVKNSRNNLKVLQDVVLR